MVKRHVTISCEWSVVSNRAALVPARLGGTDETVHILCPKQNNTVCSLLITVLLADVMPCLITNALLALVITTIHNLNNQNAISKSGSTKAHISRAATHCSWNSSFVFSTITAPYDL
ncbi:unnamed protein product [Arctia plantaginis]|uniref:Uncharacterized protein n=1 Tax=Arctia plantaginis TaxID=874455 RepID=A0A8S1B692_ARCPL|nr:unnamed protein product [Arctia plantaginis]